MDGLPLYDQVRADVSLATGGHSGLWWERFFDGFPEGWKPTEQTKKTWTENKENWLRRFDGKEVGGGRAIELACQRLQSLCKGIDGDTRTFTMTWHFATGLGLPHPMENGLLWHPTLGTPYLSGSAVKGLVRTWVEEWENFPATDVGKVERLARLYRWFGSEAKDPKERRKERADRFVPPTLGTRSDQDTEAGGFIFFDALPTAPPVLKADVMTPHMSDWYELGGKEAEAEMLQPSPADWHDPVPVQFLVVDRPSFQFAIAPRTAQAKAELNDVFTALTCALEWLGAGAKAAVGYGQV